MVRKKKLIKQKQYDSDDATIANTVVDVDDDHTNDDDNDERHSNDDGRKCRNCGRIGHVSKICPVRKQKMEEKRRCHNCKQLGHTKKQCPGVVVENVTTSYAHTHTHHHHHQHQRGQSNKCHRESTCNPIDDITSLMSVCDDGDDDDKILLFDSIVYTHKLYDVSKHHGSMSDLITLLGIPMKFFGGCIATFHDADTMVATHGSHHYRSWERVVDDPHIWLSFGLSIPALAAATVYGEIEDVYHRIKEGISLPCAVAVIASIDFTEEGLDMVDRQDQLTCLARLSCLAIEYNMPLLLQIQGELEGENELLSDVVTTFNSVTWGNERALVLIFPDSARGCSADLVFNLRRLYRVYLCVSGNCTYSRAKQLKNAVFDCPSDRLLIGTGAPHNIPSALGGGRLQYSNSGHVGLIAKDIAEIRSDDLSPRDILLCALGNAEDVFSIQVLR